MEQVLSRNAAIAALIRSPHGDLSAYGPVASDFVQRDPEFYAHLVAWNHLKGSIRDAKLALPIYGTRSAHPELAENSYAHLALASPRDFLRGVEWARKGKIAGSNSKLRALVADYLAYRTRDERLASRAILQHRKALKALYAQYHVKPSDFVERVLFKSENIGPNAILRSLSSLDDRSAAEVIIREKIPFLLLPQALGKRLASVPLAMALIEQMTPAQLAANSKMLQRLGIDTVPELRSAYREAVGRSMASSGSSALKLAKTAEVLDDGESRKIVKAAAQAQVKALSVKGDWLVIADISGSMSHSIKMACEIAALLGAVAEGKVVIAFTNTGVRALDATGKTREELEAATKFITATGGTALGAAAVWAVASKFSPDGICIVTDGADHGTPTFAQAYPKACEAWGKEPAVYVYDVLGGPSKIEAQARMAGFSLTSFDCRRGFDYYSLPNLVQTMRVNQFSLSDEIFATPLLSLADVFS